MNWYRSSLLYYPALNKLEEDLAADQDTLIKIFPYSIDPTPFTIVVPTTFKVQGKESTEINQAGSGPFQFVLTKEDPYIVLEPSPEINKRHVVSFTIETSAPAEVGFSWNSGDDWSEEGYLLLPRKGELVTQSWAGFPEYDPWKRYNSVKEIRLQLVNPRAPQTLVTIRDIQVLTR